MRRARGSKTSTEPPLFQARRLPAMATSQQTAPARRKTVRAPSRTDTVPPDELQLSAKKATSDPETETRRLPPPAEQRSAGASGRSDPYGGPAIACVSTGHTTPGRPGQPS